MSAAAVDPRLAAAYPCLRPFARLQAGAVVVDEGSGLRLRMSDSGDLEELRAGGHPRPGIAWDPAPRRRP